MNPTFSLGCSSNTLYSVAIVVTATATTNTPEVVVSIVLTATVSLLCCTMPRFIISVRELYDHDLRGHFQGIDTGFGVSSRVEKRFPSTIAFADAGEESRTLQGDADESGAIQLEPVAEGSHYV